MAETNTYIWFSLLDELMIGSLLLILAGKFVIAPQFHHYSQKQCVMFKNSYDALNIVIDCQHTKTFSNPFHIV